MNPAFDPVEFLRSHWQKKPILLKQLISDFEDLISPQELAGLACEDVIESRLISEVQSGHWRLQHGPFATSTFTKLPDSHWTLLVQAVDLWAEEVAALRALFEFIPRWRIDDVMVSFATDSGSVGPHFDYYDVFLVQGSGKRLWQLGAKVAPDTQLDNQDGVGILPAFLAEHEYVLSPGDVLYIPPQYAHFGRSIGESTCYSIGFRAPSLADMLEGFSDALIRKSVPSMRYMDANPCPPGHPAQINVSTLELAFQQLLKTANTPAQFYEFFGSWVTQPKYPELREPSSVRISIADIENSLQKGRHLLHAIGSRFAFMVASSDKEVLLFVDGEAFRFPDYYISVVTQICDSNLLNKMSITTFKKHKDVADLLVQLINQGSLRLS